MHHPISYHIILAAIIYSISQIQNLRSSRWWLTQASYALFFLLMWATWELEPLNRTHVAGVGGGCLSSAWQIWRDERREQSIGDWHQTQYWLLYLMHYDCFDYAIATPLPMGSWSFDLHVNIPNLFISFYFKTGVIIALQCCASFCCYSNMSPAICINISPAS